MKSWLKATTIVGSTVIAAVAALPLLARTSNCGGKSAALSACHGVITAAKVAAGETTDQVNAAQLGESMGGYIGYKATKSWNPGATFLVKTNFQLNGRVKEIVVICDTPNSNVPQPTVWNGYRENPAHAVGYSDGTTGLISPQAFKALNRSQFIDALDLAKSSKTF